ncbi:MAG TPA: glycosyltransferase family 4 protein, partial [Pirellulales bacterium]|nr:glycosyltransferase family 4 protein [Pirellulales bacterium]
LKCSRKTNSIFRLSDRVIAINGLIGDYAAQRNHSVSVIPNCVDTAKYVPAPRLADATVRLVWMGSHSTMQNLKSIAGPIRRLQALGNVPLRVIGAGDPGLPDLQVETHQWSADTEIDSLRDCDIGLVPLPDHPWNQWKFFYKTIQYMAMGMPVVARRMGSNSEVIEHGVDGFLVDDEAQWYESLQTLIADRSLRQRMGAAARAKVIERYSFESQMPRMVDVFEQVLQSKRATQHHARLGQASC